MITTPMFIFLMILSTVSVIAGIVLIVVSIIGLRKGYGLHYIIPVLCGLIAVVGFSTIGYLIIGLQ